MIKRKKSKGRELKRMNVNTTHIVLHVHVYIYYSSSKASPICFIVLIPAVIIIIYHLMAYFRIYMIAGKKEANAYLHLLNAEDRIALN